VSPYQPYVDEFAKRMLEKLDKNAHKGAWENMTPRNILNLLDIEVNELKDAVYMLGYGKPCPEDIEKVIYEAADVANFALIAASVALRLIKKDLLPEEAVDNSL